MYESYRPDTIARAKVVSAAKRAPPREQHLRPESVQRVACLGGKVRLRRFQNGRRHHRISSAVRAHARYKLPIAPTAYPLGTNRSA